MFRVSLKTTAIEFSPAVKQVRYKREKALSPQAEKVINQLSVLSAGRKQPRLLKLCNEDYIKHKTVMKAWSHIRKLKMKAQNEALVNQYNKMSLAMEDLKNENAQLFEIANQHGYGKRFPLEIRTPTEFPPRQIWFYEYYPTVSKKQ